MAAQQHQHVQPVQRIHQAHRDVDVVLQPVTVVDVEMEELAGQQRPRQRRPWRAAPHQLMQVFRIQAHHLRMLQQSGADEREHGIAGRQQDLGLRLERLRLQAMFQRGAIVLLRQLDIGLARGVQSVGIPAQRLGLFDGALRVIAERTRPIDRELRAQFMADLRPCSPRRHAAYWRTSGASAAGLAAHTA